MVELCDRDTPLIYGHRLKGARLFALAHQRAFQLTSFSSITHPIARSLMHSLTRSCTPSLPHFLTPSLPDSLTLSFPPSLPPYLTHPLRSCEWSIRLQAITS